MMMGCPSTGPRRLATALARISVAPPGGKGTMIVIGLVGQFDWAEALFATKVKDVKRVRTANPQVLRCCLRKVWDKDWCIHHLLSSEYAGYLI
jgi:hypothetical protein